MRGPVFIGIALIALLVIGVSAGRIIHVVSVFSPDSASKPESVASFAPHTVTRSPGGTSEVVQPATATAPQASSEDLDGTLVAARAKGVQSKRDALETRGAQPQTPLDQDLQPTMAAMKLHPGAGAQVEDFARSMAPKLAREAIEHSTDNAARNPEVEHELLETWKQQQQILAGKRDTIDTVFVTP
jgi:hypothetical protein